MSQRFLNAYEEVTYDRLRKVAEQYGAHVFAKVRVADAISVNKSGISDQDFSFSLKAHLDFLVTDSDHNSIFAVEFDGPTHRADTQIQRDRRKNGLLEHFALPLLRINSNYLNRQYRDFDLLTYFVEVWFLQEAFAKAQEEGQVPLDETFDPAFIVSDGRGGRMWPYWLSIEAQAKIQAFWKKGRVASHCPNYWIGRDPVGRFRCLMWIVLPEGGCCFVETGMRAQQFPVDVTDILMQVATFDLFDELQEVFGGRQKPRTRVELQHTIDFYSTHFSLRSSGGAASPNTEQRGRGGS